MAQFYFFGYCRLKGCDGTGNNSFDGGRYINRLEPRSHEWRISARILKGEWKRERQRSAEWNQSYMQGYLQTFGLRTPECAFRQVFGGRMHRPID